MCNSFLQEMLSGENGAGVGEEGWERVRLWVKSCKGDFTPILQRNSGLSSFSAFFFFFCLEEWDLSFYVLRAAQGLIDS